MWQAIEDLLKRSSSTRESAKDGRVNVVGTVYNIETKTVKWMGMHPEEDRLLNDIKEDIWE